MNSNIERIYKVEVDATLYGSEKVKIFGENNNVIKIIDAKNLVSAYKIKRELYEKLLNQVGEEEYKRRLRSTIEIILE